MRVRHFDLRLDVLMTSPAMTMLKKKLVPVLAETLETTRDTKLSDLHEMFFSFLVQSWLFTVDPLICTSMFLRKAFQAIELQAYLRVIALSRRDHDRETYTYASSFCLHFSICRYHHGRGSRSPQSFPVLLSSNPFCSACASKLWNQSQILFPLEFFEVGASFALTFNKRVKT